jgi:hypothetical protein
VELTGDQSKNDAFLQAIDRTAIWKPCAPARGIGRGERILRETVLYPGAATRPYLELVKPRT